MIRIATIEDAPAIARVHLLGWQQSYQGIVDQEVLNKLSYDKRLESRKKLFEDNLVKSFVAIEDNIIVGFCDIGNFREGDKVFSNEGEIYAIYLLDGYKKRGLGIKLWQRALEEFRNKNLYSFKVWLLEDNKNARSFYEKQGGKKYAEKEVKIDSKIYKEICYYFKVV